MEHSLHSIDACMHSYAETTTLVRSLEEEVKKEDAGNAGQWHVPILGMTLDVIQATHVECARCGMDNCVSKPFDKEQHCAGVARFFPQEKTPLWSELLIASLSL